MKLLKFTKTGIHFKLDDGRIGTVNPDTGYIRVNTKQSNYYHRKPLFYQINRKERVEGLIEQLRVLYEFNLKNCSNVK